MEKKNSCSIILWSLYSYLAGPCRQNPGHSRKNCKGKKKAYQYLKKKFRVTKFCSMSRSRTFSDGRILLVLTVQI